ncbi:MAG TPA: hypothetical protein VL524_09335 [Gemmatimonadaceae bacterium]|nr:hypothetical protein [Gemmatimonadaceae bacterium]
MGEARAIRPRRGNDKLARFLVYLREIEEALMRRDALQVTALLRKRTATHLPRAVREELLVLSRAPRDSLRAPVQFLRFQHRMTELARGGERLPTAQTELELEAPAAAGSIRRRDGDERRAAAGDAGEHDRGNGEA